MNAIRKRTLAFYMIVIVLIFLLTISLGMAMQRGYSDTRKKNADDFLKLYEDNITLAMKEHLNYAYDLSDMGTGILDHEEWFEENAQNLLEHEAIRYILLFKGDTVELALPSKGYKKYIGKDLQDFSYIYTVAKVVKEPVVEGPITLEGTDKKTFLFLQPLLDGKNYKGEIAVALDEDYVIEQLDLGSLNDLGYEYHLWKVNCEDGSKDIITTSDTKIDFSYASKVEFYLPTQWTLSIIPTEGWVPQKVHLLYLGASIAAGIFLSALFLSICILVTRSRYYRKLDLMDRQTGLYNRKGFCKEVDLWINAGTSQFTIFYLTVENYHRVALMAGPSKEEEYLRSIQTIVKDYVKNTHLAGRIAEGGFLVAVKERMPEQDKLDLAKGLSLKMMWKVRVNGEKLFLNTDYHYVSYPDDGVHSSELLDQLISGYYFQRSQESPIYDLTEKCRQLADGRTDVELREYADFEIMELSKVLNQYKKRVEQIAYFDPVYNIGNRMKYLKDAEMMISYDDKRRFRIYGIDICSFSKYNELFSVMTGDALLMEITDRLSTIFGSYLYRVNGDVFLGISFEDIYKNYKDDHMVSQIQAVFKRPITVEDSVFTLDALIGICDYPVNAKTPQALLECVQSAISYAKAQENKTSDGVVVYNGVLLEISRRERDILQALKNSIEEKTLEVWYQPLYNLHKKQFTGVEALVRLPDGNGSYIPAGQVIDIAEKNGMISLVGEYVMGRACEFMHEKGAELGLDTIGVNLSVQQLLVENSVSIILGHAKKAGIDPHKITLEITETVLIQSIKEAEDILSELSELGFKIALDDFGIGYSSLNYLMNLPVTTLKFDRSMTEKINSSEKQYALLKAIIEMTDINNILVVVEGVETEEELEMIAGTRADFIQGYYYSKPLPDKELEVFLKKNLKDKGN